MRLDVSLLPALAAVFMLTFARIGAMVSLMPGFGEMSVPVRIKLAIALTLTLIIVPLHRSAYQIDMSSMTPLLVLMVHEILIGLVLGATGRVAISALAVAGSVIAQQLGLGFVTAFDPSQGQQGVVIGNFLTILGLTLLFATTARAHDQAKPVVGPERAAAEKLIAQHGKPAFCRALLNSNALIFVE